MLTNEQQIIRRRLLLALFFLIKNRHKLQWTASQYKDASRPFIIAQHVHHVRLSPVCKAQHDPAPFQHRFGLFCREHKNRGEPFKRPFHNTRILLTLLSWHTATATLAPRPLQRTATCDAISTYFRGILSGAQKSTFCVANIERSYLLFIE